MGLVNGHFDCPELTTGPNCSLTWWEEMSPAAPILWHGIATVFLIYFVVICFLIWHNARGWKERLDDSKKEGYKLRRKTLFSGAIASFTWSLFTGFGANMEYHLDYWKGEVSMISLLIGNAFLVQSIQYLIVMYFESMRDRILKKKSFAIENLSVRFLSYLAVPYLLHILNFILFILLAINYHHIWDHPVEVVRLGYGVMSFYLVVDAIIFPPALNRLADMLLSICSSRGLDKESDDESSRPNTTAHLNEQLEKWKALAIKSKRLARFIVIAFPIATVFIFVETATETLTHPHEYFGFQIFWASATLIYFFLYIDLLRPHGLFSSSGRSSRQTSPNDFTSANHENSTTNMPSRFDTFEASTQGPEPNVSV
mmetsp:Transcript_1603/g.1835  ORF Transcript_1603/g.1835 Transcript_1603/m.1835 type:complete len:370 (+) Transcript_1603:36-1145(+)